MENPKCLICGNACELYTTPGVISSITCYRCTKHSHYYQINSEFGKPSYICMTLNEPGSLVHFDYYYEVVETGNEGTMHNFWIDPQKYNYIDLKNKVNAYLLLE